MGFIVVPTLGNMIFRIFTSFGKLTENKARMFSFVIIATIVSIVNVAHFGKISYLEKISQYTQCCQYKQYIECS